MGHSFGFKAGNVPQINKGTKGEKEEIVPAVFTLDYLTKCLN